MAWQPSQRVSATDLRQTYQTPTPLPDGRIIYTVQEKDSCLRIQLLTGVTIDQLRTLNKLDAECTLSVGKELLLSIVTPAPTATPDPKITPTAILPTPTAIKGTGIICFLLYNDVNGDGFQSDAETLLAGGVISIVGETISQTGDTKDSAIDPFCLEVPEGTYDINIAVPDRYNPTTNTRLSIPVKAGNQGFVDFGAQASQIVVANQTQVPVTPASGSNNLILALMGGLLVLFGLGLGLYVLLVRRQR